MFGVISGQEIHRLRVQRCTTPKSLLEMSKYLLWLVFGLCIRALRWNGWMFHLLQYFIDLTTLKALLYFCEQSCLFSLSEKKARYIYYPILSVTNLVLSSPSLNMIVALLLLLKEWQHDLCQVIPWPKRLLPWQNCHPAVPVWQQYACVHMLSVSQRHVCLSGIIAMCPCPAFLPVPDPAIVTLCQPD